jgi:hypothetical protein
MTRTAGETPFPANITAVKTGSPPLPIPDVPHLQRVMPTYA